MTPLRLVLTAVLIAATATTTACQLMMPHGGAMGGGGGGGRSAQNPLTSGQPLEATSKGDVGTVGESDCNTWPFEDKVTVAVTEAQICVEVRKHKAAPSGWSGEPTADSSEGVQVANEAGAGPYINANRAHVAKVGSCFNKGFQADTPIWAFDYKGCAPNNGTVTAATSSLTVAHESWSFPVAAPPAAPATAAN